MNDKKYIITTYSTYNYGVKTKVVESPSFVTNDIIQNFLGDAVAIIDGNLNIINTNKSKTWFLYLFNELNPELFINNRLIDALDKKFNYTIDNKIYYPSFDCKNLSRNNLEILFMLWEERKKIKLTQSQKFKWKHREKIIELMKSDDFKNIIALHSVII